MPEAAQAPSDIDQAFGQLRGAFPTIAMFQGIHFKYAARNGVTLIEQKRGDRFFYWLLVAGHFKLVHAANHSKFASMRTVGDSFKPSAAYADQ